MEGASSSVTPTFKGELYYLITKFLEEGPCQEAAQVLKRQITEQALVPPRYDWTGCAHPKTFRDIEDELGTLAPEFLLRRCFDLCTATADPSAPPVRSLICQAGQKSSSVVRQCQSLTQNHFLGHVRKASMGFSIPGRVWHEKYLCHQLKYLRRTLGHLSAVYCLTFDRTGQMVITGADDLLVKCWSMLDGRLIHTFRGASSEISDLAVSHDNRLIAAGSCDKVIRVWNLQTSAPVAVLSRHTGMITAVNFCPNTIGDDQFYLASTSGDGSVSFWQYTYNQFDEAEFAEAPTRYHEKIRPGQAQMICASFSPGGVFFCVGSADHNVRVYKMDCPDGPQRILEDDSHSDRVDSIQWCNLPTLRFLSGSKDGTARIWSFGNNKWTSIVLNMSTGDNREKRPTTVTSPPPGQPQQQQQQQQSANVPSTSSAGDNSRASLRRQPSASNGGQNARPVRAAAAAAASTIATAQNQENAEGAAEPGGQSAKNEKRVTMVAWSLDDRKVITAVSDTSLKIWDSTIGQLVSTLTGHEDEIFVLEPHPISVNILLTAAHDGQIRVWDISTLKCIYKYQNIIENQGHGAVFDAKWSPDGTMICASDSHGHLHFIGHGSAERFDKFPTELFFHTDYRPLLRDSSFYVVDEQTQLPPHLMPPPFLVDSDGAPYPAYIQKFAPGREGMTDQEALLPYGADVGPPLLAMIQQQHQEQLQQQQNQQQQNQQQPVLAAIGGFNPPLLDHLVSNDSNSSSAPESRSDTDNNSGPDRRLDVRADEQPRPGSPTPGPSRALDKPRTALSLVTLSNRLKKREIGESLLKIREYSKLESNIFNSESNRDTFDHDYAARGSSSRQRQKKKIRGRPQQQRERDTARPTTTNSSRAAGIEDNEEEDETEENQPDGGNQQEAGDDEDDTSDMSLDESDFSEESTTEVSSDHSDWGSDNHDERNKSPNSGLMSPLPISKKRSSPKAKKKRRAAQKCRELMMTPGIDNEAFMPSPWLSETLPKKSPYFPQIGDVLMYFKKGHEKYLELVKTRNAYKINMRELQWMRKKSIQESCMVKIIGIRFEIKPPRLVVLKLAILDPSTSSVTGESFTIKYHDMNDVVDFLVLHQTYSTYRGKHWKKGDRIRCQIDDCWWKGTVIKVDHYEGSKKSPFLSITVQWDNNEKEFLSPWDFEALDGDSAEIEDGTPVSVEQLRSCLYVPTSEEWNGIGRESECTRIAEALQEIMSLAIAEPFNYPVDTTVYPEYVLDVEYPVDFTLIKSRVENHFYRRIEAILFDLKHIYENAASFNISKSDIVRNAKVLWRTATEIISSPNKTKDDVSGVYHRLLETFEWSDSSSESEDNSGGKNLKRRAPEPGKVNPKQWKRNCNDLLDAMVENSLSEPFREPVSEIKYPDYHKYISTPMDLSSVRELLHCGEYGSPHDFQKDILLIFKNSRKYNTNPKSKVVTMTNKLEEWFDKRMSKLLKEWRRSTKKVSKGKDKQPKIKGKGKGLGKGQSNRIKPRRKSSSDEDESESESGSSSSDPESRPIAKSHSRRQSPGPEFVEVPMDVDDPQPCSSKSILARSAKSSQADTKHETEHLPDESEESSPDAGRRRTSNRTHRLPARFADDYITPGQSTRDPLGDDASDSNDDQDDQPLSSLRVSKSRASHQSSRHRKQELKFLKDDDDDDDDDDLDDEKSFSESDQKDDSEEQEDSEDEKPLVQRKQKRKLSEEQQSSHSPVKRPRRLQSSDEEDQPLASRKSGQRSTSANENTQRPTRAARTVKSLAEPSDDEEEDEPKIPVRPRRINNHRTSPQQSDDEDEDERKISGRPRRTNNRRTLPPQSDDEDEDERKISGRPRRTNNRRTSPLQSDDEDEDEPRISTRPRRTNNRRTSPQQSDDEDEDEPKISVRPRRTHNRRTSPQQSDDEEEDEPTIAVRPRRTNNRRSSPQQSDDDPSDDEVEPKIPVRSRRMNHRRSSPQHDHDSSEDEHSSGQRKRNPQRRAAVSKRTQQNDSDESESDVSEEDDFINDEDDAMHEDHIYTKRRKPPTRSSARPRVSAVAATKRVARDEVDSEQSNSSSSDDDDDDEYDLSPPAASIKKSRGGRPRGRPPKLTHHNSSAEVRSGRKKTRSYYDSDRNSSSERENRRPVRAAAKHHKIIRRSNSADSSLSEDEESGIPRKTTVTSRGRVCKPNPRII